MNLPKALRALDRCGGVVREVSDQEILDAKAKVGAGGLGCEPASAASVAGAGKLRQEGVIGADERVVCILTGHQLKDPTATVAYHSTDQKTFDEVLGSRGVRRADVRQPGRAGAQRPGRDHQGDRGVFVADFQPLSRIMSMRRFLWAVAAACLLAPAGGCKNENADGRLIGVWICVNPPKAPPGITETWVFNPDMTFTFTSPGSARVEGLQRQISLRLRRFRLLRPPQRERQRQGPPYGPHHGQRQADDGARPGRHVYHADQAVGGKDRRPGKQYRGRDRDAPRGRGSSEHARHAPADSPTL